MIACGVRPLAGGEEAPKQLSSPDNESATAVENAGSKIAAINGDFADVFSDSLPKGLPPRRAIDIFNQYIEYKILNQYILNQYIEHKIDLVPGSKPAARPAYKISFAFAEQAELKPDLQQIF